MEWIEDHLFICPFKAITGWDCPGCGFQRSLIALLKGDVQASFAYYPAMIAILMLAFWNIVQIKYPFRYKEKVNRSLIIFSGTAVSLSYLIKLVF